LALSKTLEICATDQKLFRKPIIIHFKFPYAHNCVTKWIKKWKKTGWVKQNNLKVSNQILLQIIDSQQNALPNVHFNYIFDKNIISGIHGFQNAK
jgi:ribonuclease HI